MIFFLATKSSLITLVSLTHMESLARHPFLPNDRHALGCSQAHKTLLFRIATLLTT